MREALVNLFIHQDFTDESAAAQVEISPEKVVCFNTGKSLVKQRALIEGGRSQPQAGHPYYRCGNDVGMRSLGGCSWPGGR